MTSKGAILVVEDDPRLGQLIANELRDLGYTALLTTNGADALEAADRRSPKAALVDLGLPDMDGIELIRQLRRLRELAIIAVTARQGLEDKLDALYAGADDYLAKPFALLELQARLHAQLRIRAVNSNRLRLGTLELDPDNQLCRVSGADVALTAREFELLCTLAKRPGRVFSAEELTQLTYTNDEPQSNALEVRVSAIRRKLREAGLDNTIRTVRGVGYAFRWRDEGSN